MLEPFLQGTMINTKIFLSIDIILWNRCLLLGCFTEERKNSRKCPYLMVGYHCTTLWSTLRGVLLFFYSSARACLAQKYLHVWLSELLARDVVLLQHHTLGCTYTVTRVVLKNELRSLILEVKPRSCFDSLRDGIHHHHHHGIFFIVIVVLMVGIHLWIYSFSNLIIVYTSYYS